MSQSAWPLTRSKACGACGAVCECAFGQMRADRSRQLAPVEVSPVKKGKKGVKVVPSRKRCKAIESLPEELDGPSPEKNKPVVVDLRSEARIAAEENSRLSKGKQIHPFFTSRISAKKTVEFSPNAKIEDKNENPPLIQQNDLSFCPPIHVHDTETSAVQLNWGNWTFKEKSSLEKSSVSVLEASSLTKVKPLTLETNGVIIPTKEIFFDLDAGCDSSKISFPSSFSNPSYDLEKENENIIYSESYQTESSLWTDKYQPENASQVCGNAESVNFFSEWLKLWHEKGRKNNKKPHFLQEISFEGSDNSWCNESNLDKMCEEEENDFQNVLLITGPVGSGKSAAVYACAKEQGFNIVEVSASDLRNGAHIKQKFGEATESHGLGKWSHEEIINGNNLSSTSVSTENNNEINGKKVVVNKTLVLFEDVDTVFDEDKGFISTILQLADSTKWPIVLTSNNKNPILPRALNHLVLEFNRPSSEELLSHLNKICTLEKTGIPIPLIEHIINSCFGDIRKTIVLLQFWCQGKKEYTAGPKENIIPFEIDAIHSILPKALNFGFQCDLSEKIHSEINQTISSTEAHLLQIELQKLINLNFSPIKPKKKTKLKKNQTFPESPEPVSNPDYLNDFNTPPKPVPNPNNLNDFNSTPKTPVPFFNQKSRKKRQLVFSDSDEEICANSQLTQNSPLIDSKALQLGLLSDNAVDPFGFNCANYSPSRVCDTFISVVPESLCDTVSVNWNFNEDVIEKNNTVLKNTDFDGSIFERNNVNIEASVSNSWEIRNVVMDECSSAEWNFNNFNNTNNSNINYYNNTNSSNNINNNGILLNEIGSVKETWERLKDKCNDLKNCMRNDCREGSEILRVTSRISDLVSDTDILFSDCNPLIYDKLDESLFPSKESNDISCNETLVEIGSVYAHHGLGLYFGSNNTAFESTTDLAKEILVSSTNSTSIGRLLGDANNEIFNEGDLSANRLSGLFSERRQKESSLYDSIFSLVPPKLAISLKGPSFHEYISSISLISKFEFSRLSETETRLLNRRSRAKHYLTCGKLQLSSEEAQLFAKFNSFNGK